MIINFSIELNLIVLSYFTKILSLRKAQIREKKINGGQSGLWKGLNLALDKETEQITNEIRWAYGTISNSSEKAQAFADFFSTKIRNIVEHNNLQEEPTNGGRVVMCKRPTMLLYRNHKRL